jgi:S-adenosylmethionine:tRNA ribosyltransferase-isomerase
MIDPNKIFIKDYNYDLPEDRIATFPLPERDASKLLIYKNENISEDIYRNLADHLSENSFLIFNDTRVVEARLLFQKPTGGVIEIFCLEPDEKYHDVTTAMTAHKKVWWQCLIGGASKWKHGQVLVKKIQSENHEIILEGRYVEKRSDCFIIELSWSNEALSFAEILHRAGAIPLPPYIKREVQESDSTRYQTIYANQEGSVAAPTAGLHFTENIFHDLKRKNIQTDFITLHVGAGTFKPVKSETIAAHEMHGEFITIKKSTIENILKNISSTIVAVGTTTLRSIESLYWVGVKLTIGYLLSRNAESVEQVFKIGQWEVYQLEEKNIQPIEALKAVLNFMNENNLEILVARTQIIIVPGYKPKLANALITNFHQPQSTLLLLVAALIGNDWKRVYNYALKNNFRFLSYGDGCLLWINTT